MYITCDKYQCCQISSFLGVLEPALKCVFNFFFLLLLKAVFNLVSMVSFALVTICDCGLFKASFLSCFFWGKVLSFA